jgi:hypothetical protein
VARGGGDGKPRRNVFPPHGQTRGD